MLFGMGARGGRHPVYRCVLENRTVIFLLFSEIDNSRCIFPLSTKERKKENKKKKQTNKRVVYNEGAVRK